jgi:energy-converting hydrogenase Eha subunit E
MNDSAPVTETPGSTGRALFWGGLALAVVGIPAFIAQSAMKRQFVPWYIPILATLGVVLLVLSLRQRRSIARFIAVGLVAAFCAFSWFALGALIRLPEYTGPAVATKKLPPFSTTLADGRPFTHADLENGQTTVLTFFRGRW